MTQSLERVINLAEHVTSPLGLQVVDARMSQQGRQRTIEVTIHRSGGRVSLDDCEAVSRELERLLDEIEKEEPVLEGAYLLEVQSPGIDRKLRTAREYTIFAGEKVEVLLKQPLDRLGAHFRGKLAAFNDGQLLIEQPQVVAEGKRKKKGTPAAADAMGMPPDKVLIESGNIMQVRRFPE